jgi:glucokinase
MTTQKRTIGIDLGGTGISFIDLYPPDEVLGTLKVETPSTKQGILRALKNGISALLNDSKKKVFGIGIAVAGQVNPQRKSLVFSPNLPFKTEYLLGQELEDFFGIPVTVENDANSAAIGEKVFGQAFAMEDFAVITLGTGIGSGIFANGKLLTGFDGSAGEAGHIQLLPDGPLCGCGQKGCLEALASGSGISKNHFNKTGRELTAKEICDLAKNGDKEAIATLTEAGEWLGTGLVTIVNLFNPQGIFFTGSLLNAPQCYFEPALERLKNCSFGTSAKRLKVGPSSLGLKTGIIGAASLPHYSAKKKKQ